MVAGALERRRRAIQAYLRVRWSILRGMSTSPPSDATAPTPSGNPASTSAPPARPTEEPSGEISGETSRETSPEPGSARAGERRRSLGHTTPVLLVRAAHPRQGLLTAAGLAVAAAISGRPGREVALVLVTVLVGQTVLGWHNDIVDRHRDAKRLPSGKPIADGYLEVGTVWFALTCALLLLVPLAITNGVTAGCLYLASVGLGLLGNVALRKGWLSWVTWAAAFALYPGFLSYGGWGGQTAGSAPQPALVALAAALGVGAHFLSALPGLVADHEDGYRHLPLRVALKLGATRLLLVSLAWTVLVLVAMLLVGNAVGLAR